MSTEQQWAFLREPVRPAILSTVRADGRPHAAPIWYDVDGETVVFSTGASTVKGKNLRRDPRATLCVHDDRPPFSFLVAEGTATLSDSVDEVRAWAHGSVGVTWVRIGPRNTESATAFPASCWCG